MFNKSTVVNMVDTRVLPSSGIITVKEFLDFILPGVKTHLDLQNFVDELEKQKIKVYKPATVMWTWFIYLDDFRK